MEPTSFASQEPQWPSARYIRENTKQRIASGGRQVPIVLLKPGVASQFSAMEKLHSRENGFGWSQQGAYRACAKGSGAWDVLLSLFKDIPASKKGVCCFTLDVPLFVVGIASKVPERSVSPVVMVALFANRSCWVQKSGYCSHVHLTLCASTIAVSYTCEPKFQRSASLHSERRDRYLQHCSLETS